MIHNMYAPFDRGTVKIRLPKGGKELTMENRKKNEHVKCTVSQCRHNLVTDPYCSLDCISVGTHEPDPEVPECTDCNSFVKRDGCC